MVANNIYHDIEDTTVVNTHNQSDFSVPLPDQPSPGYTYTGLGKPEKLETDGGVVWCSVGQDTTGDEHRCGDQDRVVIRTVG